MAPNKKKKKAAANPARGFATTSIASKPKPESKTEESPSTTQATKEAESAGALQSTSAQAAAATTSTPSTGAPKIDDLSKEEYEAHLEEADLQNFLDKNSDKVKKDVTRQVSRLQTDRRVLRTQTEQLTVRKWFQPDFVDRVCDLLRYERSTRDNEIRNIAKSKRISEDDAVVRLWTLEQILKRLGFNDERVGQTLRDLISHDVSAVEGVRDGSWGLEESLDWLSLECSPEELGFYDEKHEKKGLPVEEEDEPEPVPRPSNGKEAQSRKKEQEADLDDNEPVSDVGSDVELDELLKKHIRTRARIYEIDPQAVPAPSTGKGKSAKIKVANKAAVPVPRSVEKLLNKLRKIESDVLFDQPQADLQWTTMKVELDREAAKRRKEQHLAKKEAAEHESQAAGGVSTSDEISQEAEKAAAEMLANGSGDEAEAGGLFGEMFANLPEMQTNASTGKTTTILKDSSGQSQVIRDFGKWSGLSPKRILEEACRARDSNVSIRFSLISATTWSARHSVVIRWSKAQEAPESLSTSDFSSNATPKNLTVSMFAISTPDPAQSESYCATAALFLLFSASKSEEKIYVRLPPVWKDLYLEFVGTKKSNVDSVDRAKIKELRELIKDKIDQDREDGIILVNGLKKLNANRSGRGTPNNESTDQTNIPAVNGDGGFSHLWDLKSSTPAFKRMLQHRTQLPIYGFKNAVLEAVDQNQVIIICGETGCGKSTQVPSFVLEHELSRNRNCKVYCTEPRRISAISLAKRVSEELGEHRNDLGTSRSLVGYAIRLEANMTKETRLVYATTGIVMRMLERSNDLADITHLVLDEVHERSIDSDFLLIVLRKLLVKRPELKVVLMSATVDAQRFSSYLNGAPILTVPGRTFPVETKFLEDAIEFSGYSLDDGSKPKQVEFDDDDDDGDVAIEASSERKKVTKKEYFAAYSPRTRRTISIFNEYSIDYDFITLLLQRIASDASYTNYSKAILVFLPGIAEIRKMSDMLLGHPAFMRNWYIYALHSTISSEDQEKAFLTPPKGVRKIVLATNIAETGITIPDVTCVIDTGMHKEMRFDERRQLSRLILAFISRANAKQRRGRAGRVQAGLCFHLFTKTRHDTAMAEQQSPEMLRLSLQDLVLRVKTCNLGEIEATLSNALDPPLPKNTRRAIDSLVDVKALTQAEELTPLGNQLARLPLDVHLGKLILLGCIYSCLDMALSVAAILSSKSPFQAAFHSRSQADNTRLSFKRGNSDVLTVYAAYLAWKRVCQAPGSSEMQFCRKNCLSPQTLSNIEDVRAQLLASVVDAGFVSLNPLERSALQKARYQSSRSHNFIQLPVSTTLNENNDFLASSVIAWAFYPKLVVKDGKGWRNVGNNQTVSLHPASVNKGSPIPRYLSYYHIMQSSSKFYNTHETTIAHPISIMLLSGDASFNTYSGVVTIDGNRLRFALPDPRSFLVLKSLRAKMREICRLSFKNPDRPLPSSLLKWLDLWQEICLTAKLAEERAQQ